MTNELKEPHTPAPRMPLDRRAIHDLVDKLLAPGGLAVRAGMLHKEEQLEYAHRVAECLERGDRAPELASILAISADTGLGKTLGYGVPLMAYAAQGRRVAIATNSLALQHQMIGSEEKPGDLRKVQAWLDLQGASIKIARRMGQQAFVSAAAIDNVISKIEYERTPITSESKVAFDTLRDFARHANASPHECSGLMEDALDLVGGALPMGVLPAQICLDADSPAEDHACYKRNREEVANANVVVMTHHYMAVCSKFYREFFAPKEDAESQTDAQADAHAPFDALVVDEADRLADAASSVFRNDLSLSRLQAAFLDRPDAAQAASCVEKLIATLGQIPSAAKAIPLSQISKPTLRTLEEQSHKCADAIRSLVKTRKKRLVSKAHWTADDIDWFERMREAGTLLREAFEVSLSLQDVSETSSQGDSHAKQSSAGKNATAISFSPVRSLPSISSMPVHPGDILRRLWVPHRNKLGAVETRSPLHSAIFTSATLIAPGADPVAGFKDIARHIGVDQRMSDDPKKQYQSVESDLWGSFQPSQFGQMCFVFCDPSIGAPIIRSQDEEPALDEGEPRFEPSPEWLAYVSVAIKKAHSLGGNTLVLTRSYPDTSALAELARSNGLTVLEHKRGMSMKDMKAQYQSTNNAIWLTPCGWEGLDLPGKVQNLIVTRLPFQPPDAVYEALLAHLWKILPERAHEIVSGDRMNSTKRILAQAFGRGNSCLSRSNTDAPAAARSYAAAQPAGPAPTTIASQSRSIKTDP